MVRLKEQVALMRVLESLKNYAIDEIDVMETVVDVQHFLAEQLREVDCLKPEVLKHFSDALGFSSRNELDEAKGALYRGVETYWCLVRESRGIFDD